MKEWTNIHHSADILVPTILPCIGHNFGIGNFRKKFHRQLVIITQLWARVELYNIFKMSGC